MLNMPCFTVFVLIAGKDHDAVLGDAEEVSKIREVCVILDKMEDNFER